MHICNSGPFYTINRFFGLARRSLAEPALVVGIFREINMKLCEHVLLMQKLSWYRL
jgi:hypothetical protein